MSIKKKSINTEVNAILNTRESKNQNEAINGVFVLLIIYIIRWAYQHWLWPRCDGACLVTIKLIEPMKRVLTSMQIRSASARDRLTLNRRHGSSRDDGNEKENNDEHLV